MPEPNPPHADADRQARLAQLPAVDRLLAQPELAQALARLRRPVVLRALRLELEQQREALLSGRREGPPAPGEIAARAAAAALDLLDGGMRRVINASGVVLHTGLGRARLPERALARLNETLAGAADLELRLPSGARGQREERVAERLCALTGAEAALVVNNNAAAVALMLGALCARREVIVSRGQQVEIGGGFRIPEVIRASGAKLVEVGATNRTHPADYESAIGPRTAAILRVHTSNYRVIGFTRSVPLEDLAALARARGLWLLDDLGSGALVDFPGVADPEPLVSASIEAGADLVSFSGDKMLGGPQAGLLIGRREAVRRLARHPLMRAFRCDRMSLAALEATLEIYLEAGEAHRGLPVWRACNEDRAMARARALALLVELARLAGGPAPPADWPGSRLEIGGAQLSLEDSSGRTGSGALPEQELASAALRVSPGGHAAQALHRRLRLGRPAVVAQVRDGALLVDLKAVDEGEIGELARRLHEELRPRAARE
jgi:L-seryl-tRNA(Ser) seleniumtransferase